MLVGAWILLCPLIVIHQYYTAVRPFYVFISLLEWRGHYMTQSKFVLSPTPTFSAARVGVPCTVVDCDVCDGLWGLVTASVLLYVWYCFLDI